MSTVQGSWRGYGIVRDGLVLYLDASSPNSYNSNFGPTTWKDISGNGNNGTLVNGPTFNSSNGGNLVFDGIDDYITRNISLPDNNITACVWVKNNNVSNTQRIFSHGNFGLDVAGNNFSLQIFNSTVRGIVGVLGSSQFVGNGTTINSNFWYNITLTLGGGKLTLYLNGDLKVNDSTNSTIGTSSYTLNIATRANNTSEFFQGNIAQTSIYNRALSAQEVLQNYNATKTRFGL